MRFSRSNVRRLGGLAALLGVLALLLALLGGGHATRPARSVAANLYAPGPDEANSLNGLDSYWAARVTYPTGNFDQRWLRKAAREARLVRSAVPAGARPGPMVDAAGRSKSALALSGSAFTFLGPQPQESDPAVCNGLCFSFGRVAGRVSTIALDPATTTPGQMTAYFGADGGGVWKSTNCCDAATLWTVTTDASSVSTTAIDDIFVDPLNSWVYVATGDVSFGSLAFGSAGILRSKDQGATWEVLGANVFKPGLPVPVAPNNFPQYQAVSKVKVDPNNDQTIIAGTKNGLYLSYDQGTSWKGPCYTNSYTSQRQDITDMLTLSIPGGSSPKVVNNQTRLYVAVGARGFPTAVQPNLGKNGANGIYSTIVPATEPAGDGCPAVADWTLLTSSANGWPAGTGSGLPCDPPTMGIQGDSTKPDNSPAPCAAGTDLLGRIEMAMSPSNPQVIYAEVQAVDVHGPEASHGGTPCGVLQRVPAASVPGRGRGCFLGLWRTTDGGATWQQRANQADLYNLTTAGPCGEDTPQNWYNEAVAVDPTNPDVLYMDAIDIWKSTNGGDTLVDVSCGYYTGLINNPVHVDNHVLVYAPPVNGVANTLLAGSDGGIYVSSDAANVPDPALPGLGNPPTFNEINNSVGTIEFYSGDISANFATSATPTIVAGAQDNGSSSFQWPAAAAIGCTPACNWQQRIGGDGMFARIEAKEGLRVYMESQNGAIRTSATGHAGEYSGSCGLTTCAPTWPWNTATNQESRSFVFPYELDKFDCVHNNPSTTTCDHIIAGSYRVWESVTTGGVTAQGTASTWYAASPNLTKGTLGTQCFFGSPTPSDCRSYINQLTYAPSDNRVALAGTNDGNVQYGFNLGTGVAYGSPCVNCASWVNVTDSNTTLPNRPILDVAIDPTNPLLGYASIGGFDENTPGTAGHVFQVTCDANCANFTWANKTGNLPNIPADSIIVNPNNTKQVFVGTDWGLYFTNDVTAATPVWNHFTNGLPNTMIWDMAIDRGATTLAVFTRGRGAFALLLPGPPSAVKVTGFSARTTNRGVSLSWRTGSELQTVGFNVWRYASVRGKGVKVNRALVPARNAGGEAGAAYRLLDRGARPGVAYTYRLQALGLDGKRAWRASATLRS